MEGVFESPGAWRVANDSIAFDSCDGELHDTGLLAHWGTDEVEGIG